MNIVLDSNILFSALIKNSKTRRLIIEYDGFFLVPSLIIMETKKHISLLLNKSGVSSEELEKLYQLLMKRILIIPNENLIPFKAQALELAKSIDPDDTLFFAAALAYPDSILWSDDKKLKKQDRVNVLNTQEIITFFNQS